MGKEILTGPKSEFVAFCESVAEALGWPTDGMSEAVRLRSLSHAEWIGLQMAFASRKGRRKASSS
jgi:hypothetical protein